MANWSRVSGCIRHDPFIQCGRSDVQFTTAAALLSQEILLRLGAWYTVAGPHTSPILPLLSFIFDRLWHFLCFYIVWFEILFASDPNVKKKHQRHLLEWHQHLCHGFFKLLAVVFQTSPFCTLRLWESCGLSWWIQLSSTRSRNVSRVGSIVMFPFDFRSNQSIWPTSRTWSLTWSWSLSSFRTASSLPASVWMYDASPAELGLIAFEGQDNREKWTVHILKMRYQM